MASAVVRSVVNSSTAFLYALGHVSLFLSSPSARCHRCSVVGDLGTGRGSFKVHLFNTRKNPSL